MCPVVPRCERHRARRCARRCVHADVRAAVYAGVCPHALDTLTLKAGLMSHSKRDTYVTQSETHVRSTFVDERHRSIIWSAASATAAVAVAAAAAAASSVAAAASLTAAAATSAAAAASSAAAAAAVRAACSRCALGVRTVCARITVWHAVARCGTLWHGVARSGPVCHYATSTLIASR